MQKNVHKSDLVTSCSFMRLSWAVDGSKKCGYNRIDGNDK